MNMDTDVPQATVLASLRIDKTDQVDKEYTASGIIPNLLVGVDIKKTTTLLGLTPDDFGANYSSVEFDFEALKKTFNKYCKDFNDQLIAGKPSKALEFCSKILFEYGPYIRVERKTRGDKGIRFRFPYKRDTKTGQSTLSTLTLKTVLVTTFEERQYIGSEINDKMILTFRQAALLSMITYAKAIEFCYNTDLGTERLFTPSYGGLNAGTRIAFCRYFNKIV